MPRKFIAWVGAIAVMLIVIACQADATKYPTRNPTTRKPTRLPTAHPSKNPTRRPTTSNKCSGAPCADATNCRSEYGYCGGNALSGTSDAWCNDKSTWKAAGCSGTTSTSAPTPKQTLAPAAGPTSKSPTTTNAPVASGGSCTGDPCAIQTQCRSQWGYCGGDVTGSGDDYCNALSTWKSTGCGAAQTTKSPTLPPGTTAAPTSPTTNAPTPISESVADVLHRKQSAVSSQLLISETPQSTWVASTVYNAVDLESAVRSSITGFAGLSFIGMAAQGKLNLAAFIAESMKETIRYDVCDENSWDLVNGVYPASNACGQLGQSYQDYTCSAAEKQMECPLNASMEATALTNAKWWGAPPPLSGAPKSKTGTYTPGWDAGAACANSNCDVYPGQQGGAWKTGFAYANTAGRTDTENCVWWGRGAIQVTGRCNFGKINYFLGKGAKDRGVVDALFPDIDFCRDPSAICKSTKYPQLKFITSFYYWMRDVQEYNSGGWNFKTELAALAAGGYTDVNKRKAFINAVSGIVNRGSHGSVADGQAERAANFETAYAIFFS